MAPLVIMAGLAGATGCGDSASSDAGNGSATGGTTATGGTSATGGTDTSSGGATATGGTSATGGTDTSSGGATATGGSDSGSGGMAGGGPVARSEVRAYWFGHSLTAFDQPNTSVGGAMCALATIEGDDCCGNGRWAAGFDPSTFANYPEPIAAQGQGPSCITDSFADGDVDSVVITETNFYWRSPVDTSVTEGVKFIEFMRGSYYPDGDIFLYEHWPEFSDTDFATWKATDHAPYHRWFSDLQDGLNAGLDGTRVRLVPVGRVYARILREVPSMDALTQDDLFVDDDPHGTPVSYFISGLVHYMVLYGKMPSTDAASVAALPAYLPAAVSGSYADIVELAWQELQQVVDSTGESRVW